MFNELYTAATTGNVKEVRRLVRGGVDVNERNEVCMCRRIFHIEISVRVRVAVLVITRLR